MHRNCRRKIGSTVFAWHGLFVSGAGANKSPFVSVFTHRPSGVSHRCHFGKAVITFSGVFQLTFALAVERNITSKVRHLFHSKERNKRTNVQREEEEEARRRETKTLLRACIIFSFYFVRFTRAEIIAKSMLKPSNEDERSEKKIKMKRDGPRITQALVSRDFCVCGRE